MDDERSKQLAGAIESKMKERGLSRIEFAEALNTQPSTVTRWLSGKHNFTIDTLFKIETTLQFSIFNFDNRQLADEWSWNIKKNRKKLNNPH